MIGEYEKISYEDALSKFSWADFFEKFAGGLLLENLKSWSKQNYDFVLIDSRTGFADVAGICTMQLPDTVALCFVMNRQNIDGTARVAAAIREIREEEVKLRAVPMRLARAVSSEGSDAEARAMNELTRIGGFSQLAVQEDIRTLSIQTYDDIPSYETLAPFAAREASYDQLTLDYAKLASNILDMEVKIPNFDSTAMQLIKRRLRPQHATVDYLKSLTQREPDRAVSEYRQLIESAFEIILNDDYIDRNYFLELIKAGDQISEIAADLTETISLRMTVIDLLKALTEADQETWKILLVDKLGELCNMHGYAMDDDLQLSLLEELDTLLSTFASLSLKIRRIYFRRSASLIYLGREEADSSMRIIGEMLSLRKDMPEEKLAQDQLLELKFLDVEIVRIQAELAYLKQDHAEALIGFKRALAIAGQYSSSQKSTLLDRARYSILLRLTQLPDQILDSVDSAYYALRAVRECWSAQRLATGFTSLAEVVLRVEQNIQLVIDFCEALAAYEKNLTRYLANYYGRHPVGTIEFLKVVRGLISVIQTTPGNQERHRLGEFFADACSQVMRAIMRRRRTIGEKQLDALQFEFEWLRTLFDRLGVHVEMYDSELENKFLMSHDRPNFNIDEDY